MRLELGGERALGRVLDLVRVRGGVGLGLGFGVGFGVWARARLRVGVRGTSASTRARSEQPAPPLSTWSRVRSTASPPRQSTARQSPSHARCTLPSRSSATSAVAPQSSSGAPVGAPVDPAAMRHASCCRCSDKSSSSMRAKPSTSASAGVAPHPSELSMRRCKWSRQWYAAAEPPCPSYTQKKASRSIAWTRWASSMNGHPPRSVYTPTVQVFGHTNCSEASLLQSEEPGSLLTRHRSGAITLSARLSGYSSGTTMQLCTLRIGRSSWMGARSERKNCSDAPRRRADNFP